MELFNDREPVVFEVGTAANLSHFNSYFSQKNKKDLENYVSAAIKCLKKPVKVLDGAADVTNGYFPDKKSYHYTKDDFIRVCALFHCKTANLRLLISVFPEEVKIVLLMMLDKGFVSSNELSDIGAENLIQQKEYYYSATVHPLMSLFAYVRSRADLDKASDRYYYYSDDFYLFIPPFLRDAYALALEPEKCNIESWTVGKIYDNLLTANAEQAFIGSYPVIEGLMNKGTFNNEKLKVTPSAATKLVSKTTIQEIHPVNIPEKKMSVGQYFIPFLNIALVKKNKKRIEEIVKTAYNAIYGTPFQEVFPVLLSHIKGFRSNRLSYSENREYFGCLHAALRTASEKWVVLDPLNYFLHNGIDANNTCGLSLTGRFFYECSLENSITGKSIYLNNQSAEIDLEYLKALCMALYGLGIVELAYDPHQECSSPCGCIKAARLTALGRYVVGLDSEYTAEASNSTDFFEVDADHLIIKSLVPGNPCEGLLSEVSTQISGNRYLLSYNSFLDGCKDSSDVGSKIDYFQKYICSELPPLWKKFFAEIKRRCNPFTNDPENYYVMTINPDDKAVINLVKSDTQIRSMVIMAEGYRILVPQSKYASFRKKMQSKGYLL